MTRVMCAGTFDFIHPGHLYYLTEAKKLGNELVVVVSRDSTANAFKGKKPVHSENERLIYVMDLRIADSAVWLPPMLRSDR